MFTQLLQKLCNENGISGAEETIAARIINEIKDHCEYQIDPLGNILAFKKGAAVPTKKIMVAAHMDEVGLIVTGYTTDGNLCFSKVGGIDDRVIIGRQVSVGKEKIPGVIGTKPIHLQSDEERKTVVSADNLYVDIGCDTDEEARALIPLGEFICFWADFAAFGNGCFKGKAIDDRLGCAMMIEQIQSSLPFDTMFAFCVQEEIGTRGSAVAAYTLNP
ncbi:MAG: M42 family peptidase, partial [Oscillospiraceae bacterium]